MGLKEILIRCGVKEPFDKDGNLTKQGNEACEKLRKIVDGWSKSMQQVKPETN